jgi:hypothetical protein
MIAFNFLKTTVRKIIVTICKRKIAINNSTIYPLNGASAGGRREPDPHTAACPSPFSRAFHLNT